MSPTESASAKPDDSASSAPVDRRASPRYEFSGDADVSWDETTAPVLTAEVKDISLGGCFLGINKQVAVNTPVRLRLHLGGTTFEIPGVVRRSQERVGIAIEFATSVPLGD